MLGRFMGKGVRHGQRVYLATRWKTAKDSAGALIKFIKVWPTACVLQFRCGKVVGEGLGLSFFYYAPTTSFVSAETLIVESRGPQFGAVLRV
jgi:hypothetical protein